MPHVHLTLADTLFVVSSAIGLWYSAGILPHYYGTWRNTRRVRDASERRLAGGLHLEMLATEALRTTVHLLFLVAGVWSAFLAPPPVVIASPHLAFDVYFLWTLVVANIAITVNTLIVRWGYRERRGARGTKPLPSRAALAAALHRLRLVERRQTHTDARLVAEEQRNDRIEERADATQTNVDEHGVRLDTAEEVIEIKHTTVLRKGETP